MQSLQFRPDPVRPMDETRTTRAGAAALDYILAIGVVLPLLAVVMPLGRKAMRLVYEMTATLVSWPFM